MSVATLSSLSALVLDAQDSHALAAIRSLGRQDVRVFAASPKLHAMGSRSRFCHRALRSPDPASEPRAYADWLLSTLSALRFDALLFFGEASANVVAAHREAIRARTGCLVPDYDTFLTADRKDRVMRLAAATGIPVPATQEIDAHAADDLPLERLTFPAVVKAAWGSGGHQVQFVRAPEQFLAAIRQVTDATPAAAGRRCLVQEFVPGVGYGYTALAERGEVIASFMHRRLAEHDIERGTHLAHAATGAESVDEPELRASGVALLRALAWDGMAMVEFRRSARNGHFYLMEVNPRFPGSLDLAIAAGVDFPTLYVLRATGQAMRGPDHYAVGLRYRWIVSKGVVEAAENPLGYACSVASVLRPDTRCDVSLGDPRPHLAQVREAAWWLRQSTRAWAPVAAATGTLSTLRATLSRGRAWLTSERGYVPTLSFGVLLAAMQGFTYPRGDHRLDLAWEGVCLFLGLLGLAVRVTTVGFAGRGAAALDEATDEPAALDTTGPYSVTQHPYELGTLLMWLGVAAFPRKWWLPALALLVFWLHSKGAMREEEQTLRRRIGGTYTRWAATTPRFLPRFSLWKPPQTAFALRRVLRREHAALLALVTCLTCLEIVGDWSITKHISIDLEWTSLFTTTAIACLSLAILKQRRFARA